MEPFFTSVISYLNIAAEDTFRLEFPWSCGQKIHCLSANFFLLPQESTHQSQHPIGTLKLIGEKDVAHLFHVRCKYSRPVIPGGSFIIKGRLYEEENQPHRPFLE